MSSVEQRRAKYDIYADMIEIIAKKGLCSLTLLSYGANLPVDRAKKALQLLVSHGFVKEVTYSYGKKYRAAKRGLEFLETYKKLQKFFAGLDEPVSVSMPRHSLPGRLPTGYDELDNLLFGGIPENYAVVLTSVSCDERRTLIRNFLEAGLRSGNVTFDVTTEVAAAKMLTEFPSNFHVFICNPLAEKSDDLSNVTTLKGVGSLTEISIALNSSFRRLEPSTNQHRRVCIEILSDVLLQHHALDTRRWLIGLLTELRSRNFTTLAVLNPYMHKPEEVQAIVDLFEGEINIYEKELKENMVKYLKITKMYNQDYIEQGISIKTSPV